MLKSLRTVVLGGEGMLGRALVRLLPAHGYEIVSAVGRAACDITDKMAVTHLLGEHRPDVVFNAAAYTNVDAAEDEVERSWQVNALASEVVANSCAQAGATLVHFSTDFVFNGELERPYDEFDPPSPQGVYARSKLAGEILAAKATKSLFVVRVGCLYGLGGRNFPSTIAARLRAGQKIQADASRMGSPSWTDDVVRTVAPLASGDNFGLYHCTSGGETSWFDYARFVARELGVPDALVSPADPQKLGLRAQRPRRAVLDNLMLRLRGLDVMPSWDQACRVYLSELQTATSVDRP